jgi:hypothetical protein
MGFLGTRRPRDPNLGRAVYISIAFVTAAIDGHDSAGRDPVGFLGIDGLHAARVEGTTLALDFAQLEGSQNLLQAGGGEGISLAQGFDDFGFAGGAG